MSKEIIKVPLPNNTNNIRRNLQTAPDAIKKQKLDIWIVSYGGSGSNALVSAFEKNGYQCRVNIWKNILCHSPCYVKCGIPIIYVYDDIKKAMLSMKRRGTGYWDVNQSKLSNQKVVENMSDENLLQLMIKQFHAWTDKKRSNVLIIKTEDMFKPNILQRLKTFLRKVQPKNKKHDKLKHFPLTWKTPTTHVEENNKLFEKYKEDIEYINNFPHD